MSDPQGDGIDIKAAEVQLTVLQAGSQLGSSSSNPLVLQTAQLTTVSSGASQFLRVESGLTDINLDAGTDGNIELPLSVESSMAVPMDATFALTRSRQC